MHGLVDLEVAAFHLQFGPLNFQVRHGIQVLPIGLDVLLVFELIDGMEFRGVLDFDLVVCHHFCHVEIGLGNFVHQSCDDLILPDGIALLGFDLGQHARPIGRQSGRFDRPDQAFAKLDRLRLLGLNPPAEQPPPKAEKQTPPARHFSW